MDSASLILFDFILVSILAFTAMWLLSYITVVASQQIVSSYRFCSAWRGSVCLNPSLAIHLPFRFYPAAPLFHPQISWSIPAYPEIS